jgi:hypothetical protein
MVMVSLFSLISCFLKKPDLKSFFAIFLFICLVLPFLGTYAWLSGRIESAKESASLSIKRAIPQNDQILWTFSITDARSKLHWEHSREFEYKGEMYDIIRSQIKGDSVWYWCYWDRKEAKLKKQLNILVARMMGPGPYNRNERTQINDFFRSFFFQTTSREHDVICHHLINPDFSQYNFSVSLHELTPPFPPPKVS